MDNKKFLDSKKSAKKQNCSTCMWVEHVRQWSKEKNMPYWLAMRDKACGEAYRKRK